MTSADFRKAALRIPGAIESAHGGHPDFRIDGKVFASLGNPDDSCGMVKLTPDEQLARVQDFPKLFSPCVGAWGKRGYTTIHLASATKDLVIPALEDAAKNIASSAKKRKRGTT